MTDELAERAFVHEGDSSNLMESLIIRKDPHFFFATFG
jgi:hypothetical protein